MALAEEFETIQQQMEAPLMPSEEPVGPHFPSVTEARRNDYEALPYGKIEKAASFITALGIASLRAVSMAGQFGLTYMQDRFPGRDEQ